MNRVAIRFSRKTSRTARTVSLRRLAGVIVLTGLMSACGKRPAEVPSSSPSATPASASTSATAPTPAPDAVDVAAEETEVVPPRPTILVLVEGGPDDTTIWRGWPVLVHTVVLHGEPSSELTVRGPSAITPERRGEIWVIPPAASAQLVRGAYTFSVGADSTEVAVADPPGELTPALRSIQRRLAVRADLALDDADAARRTALAWTVAEPQSPEAQAMLGDALRAAGDRTGAAAAYNEAIRLVPPGIRPPGSLHQRAAELMRDTFDALPAIPAQPRNADETAYFDLIDAGDVALAAGDRAGAQQKYAAAEALHHDRHLTISRGELDEKRAVLRGSSGTPGVASANPPPSASVSPPTPGPAVGATAPVAATPVAPLSSTPLPMPVLPSAPGSAPTSASNVGVVIAASEFTDAKILADAAGQWAVGATAGSQYGRTQYSATQATGAPNVPVVGNSPDAWCPAGKNDGTDWLEVTFAKPARAIEVRIRQNDTVGAITRIEAIEPDGTAHVWWEGSDPNVPATRDIVWFAVRVPRTEYLVERVKITLNLAAVPGWKEIDAVQLVSAGN